MYWNYINILALPMVFTTRKLRRLFRGEARQEFTGRLEDKILPRSLDVVLSMAFKALACQTLIRFPAGVGLLVIAKRR
jgi:hypothetical protein